MSNDLFAKLGISVSKVAKGVSGKVMLFYGDSDTGKTTQATRFEKPLYLGFEDGLRAISGVPFRHMHRWRDFTSTVREITNPRNIEKWKEVVQTVIIDEVYASARLCQDYVLSTYGFTYMGENAPKGVDKPNTWTVYEQEYFKQINMLLKSGFTVIFIGHSERDRDTGKIVPKGSNDKRSMDVVKKNSDIVVYLEGHPVDENGDRAMSSAYLIETEDAFARSRFNYITPKLDVFTAENLEQAIKEAVEKEEQASGIKAVTFEEQSEIYKETELDYDDLMEEVKAVGKELQELGKIDDVYAISHNNLGNNKFVTDCVKGQEQVISIILEEMKELLEVTKEEA